MSRQFIESITCDVCGEPLVSDCMTVAIGNDEFYVCLPRTAPINKCGNQTKRKLLQVFVKSEVAEARLSELDQAD